MALVVVRSEPSMSDPLVHNVISTYASHPGHTTWFPEADRYVFPSQWLYDHMAARGIDFNGRARVIRSGTDLDRFTPEGDRDSRIAVLPGVTFLLLARALDPVKGAEDAIVAIDAAIRAGADVSLAITVDTEEPFPAAVEELARLRALVENRALSDRVLLIDAPFEEVDGMLRACDVVLLPTRLPEGGLPFSAIQAVASGRPLIASDAGGLRELADLVYGDSAGATLVVPCDVESITAKSIEFSRSPELRDYYGRLGRDMAEKYFDVHRMDAEYFSLYAELAPSLAATE